MDEKFIGTFELTNGSVIISDPCYKKGTWCQGKLENVKTGTWNTVVIEEDDEGLICYRIEEKGEIIALKLVYLEEDDLLQGFG